MRVIAALAVVAALHAQAVQQSPRDTRQPREATGTGTIRGHVTAADTGAPIRKATVMLTFTPPLPPPSSGNSAAPAATGQIIMGGGAPGVVGGVVGSGPIGGVMMRPRQVQTDQNGAFEFTQLATGTYRVIVMSPQYSGQYLGMPYGATKPSGPGGDNMGKTIDLSNGETFDRANVALPRGGVIVGRVTDESGLPMARVSVYGLFYPNGGSRGNRVGMGAQTDDLGQFRVFGLQPGEYAVVAEARNMTFVPPGAPQSDSDDDRTGYLTTFYPASSDEANAQRVRVSAGREISGIEIRIATGRMYRVSGMVIDSQGQPLSGANGQLIHRMFGTSGYSGMGFSTDAQGKFQMQNIPGGDYRIVIRQRPMGPPVNGQPPEPGEMAMMPLTLNGTDALDLVIATSQGNTVTGHLVFEPSPPDMSSSKPQFRVVAMSADPSMSMGMTSPSPGTVQPDGSFTMKGLMGEYMLRVIGLQPTWYVKSMTAGTDDVMDAPHAFKQADDVTVVISTRAAALDGTVTDAKGDPAADVWVLLFSDDKANWRMNSTWTKRAVTTSKGRFRLTGVRPGRYYAIAVTRDRLNTTFGSDPKADAALLEELAKDATTVVVNEDEQRTLDLRVTGISGS